MADAKRPARRREVAHRRLECSGPARGAAATDAVPGSEEKIRVLIRRASRREELHQPGDLVDDPARALAYERAQGNGAIVKQAGNDEEGAGTVILDVRPDPGEQNIRNQISFGERLRALRLAAGLKQATLGRRAGLSQNHISQLERDLWLPSLPSFLAIAQALGVCLEMLAGLAALPPAVLAALRRRARPTSRRKQTTASKVTQVAAPRLDGCLNEPRHGYNPGRTRGPGDEADRRPRRSHAP